MPDLSSIKLPDNNIYNLKDAVARASIPNAASIDEGLISFKNGSTELFTLQLPGDISKADVTDVPNAVSISNSGLISFKHGSTELFTLQLPLYNGGVS